MVFVPEDEPNVEDMLDHLQAEIEALLAQMEAIGIAPQPYFRADVAIQTLVQFIFQSPDEMQQFALANNINVRNRLRAMLEAATGPKLVTPR